jgi:Tol biopolymer transport system component
MVRTKRRTLAFVVISLLTCLASFASQFAAGQAVTVQHPRALLINFDPIIESRSNRRLHTVGGWNDPTSLTNGYISDFQTYSHGILQYRLARVVNADVFPIKEDGFRYSDDSYLQCLSTWSGWHQPDLSDYKAKCRDYDLARKVDSGEIDEVLDHSAPYFGGYETRMIGRGGYWCNSPALPRVACSKIFIISVFNYERGVGEMLEDFGHRTESIMRVVYGSWDAQPTHAWNRFTLYDKELPGEAGCGNVHYAPNSQSDYDWGNTTYVWSYCDDWLNNYPNLQGTKKWVNCSEWGNGDIRGHHRWWFNHMPHVAGSTTEYGMTRLNNWWEYMQNFNAHPESGGDFAPGGAAPPAQAYPIAGLRLTSNTADDWAPEVNASGRVVWHGWDGNDFEIYSASASGGTPVRITNNTYNDEDPKINASGRTVWQGFDGQDYEIFSANADGTGLVQITNNATNDWHPEINDLGRIVWESFDGTDYEIYSANADGTDVVQITNNTAASGYPREDVWPQINNSNRIVWFGYDGSNWEIFSANADGTGLVNISNNSYENEYPRINDAGRVVWQAWVSNTNTEIFSADAAGGPVTRLTNNSVEDWWPQINASGQVVWMQRVSGDWEIARVAATGGAVTYVTNNTAHDQYPRIDAAGRIVWQGFDGHDWEIYMLDGGQVWQLTNNDYDDRWPAINNGVVVWHAEAGGGASGSTSEIYALDAAGGTPPAALDQAVQTFVNTALPITLQGSSAGGRPLVYTITSLPAIGRLRDDAGNVITSVPYTVVNQGQVVRYRPADDYDGSDSFRFKVNDGNDSPDAMVSISVGGFQAAYSFSLDTSPGWMMQGQWSFGQPMGGGGGTGNPDPTAGHTGTNVYGYNLGGDYAPNMLEQNLTTTAINCAGLTRTTLRFWRWLGVERAPNDHAYVRVSNNGTTWVTIWQNPSTADTTDSAWTLQEFDISAVADNQPTVYIRWTMGTTNTSRQFCGWNIDDVEIAGANVHPVRIADLDWDGDVDLSDFNAFQACFNGPNRPAASPDCGDTDFDRDNDVDLADFSAFQACFNGPNRPPGCGS